MPDRESEIGRFVRARRQANGLTQVELGVLPECLEPIQRSALTEDMKARYAELLRERTAVLGG